MSIEDKKDVSVRGGADDGGLAFFEFGDPLSAVGTKHLSDYLGVFLSHSLDEYYVPPVSMKGLIQLMKANPHHGTMPSFRANMLLKYFIDNPLLPRKVLKWFAIDIGATGNGYLQFIRNRFGVVVSLKHLPAVNMRRLPEADRYGYLDTNGKLIKFMPGEVFHFIDYDPQQQIYGVPYWFGAVQSILLGEDARLFPRRFFKNGAHAGNLLVTSGLESKEEEALKFKLSQTKGIGNFRSAHLGLPKGDVDKSVKIIPIGEIASKIEFKIFYDTSATDIMEAWRTRPELAGMRPENAGGSGDLDKIVDMNYENEVIPFQQDVMELNLFLPARYKIEFREKEKRSSANI